MGLMNQKSREWNHVLLSKVGRKSKSDIAGVIVCWIKITTMFTVSWDCLPGLDRKHHSFSSMSFLYLASWEWLMFWCQSHFGWRRVILFYFFYIWQSLKRQKKGTLDWSTCGLLPSFSFFTGVRMQADARLWRKTFEQLSWNKVEPLLLLVQHRLLLLSHFILL